MNLDKLQNISNYFYTIDLHFAPEQNYFKKISEIFAIRFNGLSRKIFKHNFFYRFYWSKWAV